MILRRQADLEGSPRVASIHYRSQAQGNHESLLRTSKPESGGNMIFSHKQADLKLIFSPNGTIQANFPFDGGFEATMEKLNALGCDPDSYGITRIGAIVGSVQQVEEEPFQLQFIKLFNDLNTIVNSDAGDIGTKLPALFLPSLMAFVAGMGGEDLVRQIVLSYGDEELMSLCFSMSSRSKARRILKRSN